MFSIFWSLTCFLAILESPPLCSILCSQIFLLTNDSCCVYSLFHFDPTVGTEELGHLEMIGAIVHQLTRNLKDSQIQDSAFSPYFVDHTTGVFPTAAAGSVYNSGMMQVKGDPIADLAEDLAADAPVM